MRQEKVWHEKATHNGAECTLFKIQRDCRTLVSIQARLPELHASYVGLCTVSTITTVPG